MEMTEVVKLDPHTEVIQLDADQNVKEVSSQKWRFKPLVKKAKKRLIESVPISAKQMKKGDVDDIEELKPERVKTKLHSTKVGKKKERFRERIEKKIRAEVLNQSEEGGLVTEEGKQSYFVTQRDIVDAVDVAAATKHFNLDLDFGPYRAKYTRNGRHLLLGGQKGHLAAFDWLTKTLHTEFNVTEKVNDVAWLHSESMFAAAQRRWSYIYDKNGVELHCIKTLFNVHSLEFLPRHFLLAAMSNEDMLSYLDVSTGQMVQQWRMKQKNNTCLTQNSANAILVTGNTKVLAHKAPLSGVAINRTGEYMTTTGLDKQLKIWDLRMYKELGVYRLPFPPTQVAVSQTNQVAVACGVNVNVYQDTHIGTTTQPYLLHRAPSAVSALGFCPYEDVLGIGHLHGFNSVLVPGAGEPNFDALHENPFESRPQRREREVRQLLEKLQPDTIALDPTQINQVNRAELHKNLKYKEEVMHWHEAKTINTDPSRYFKRKKTLK